MTYAIGTRVVVAILIQISIIENSSSIDLHEYLFIRAHLLFLNAVGPMRKVTSNAVAILAIMFVVILSISGIVSALPAFYDDFSGTLGKWNVLSGSWSIETEELSQSIVDSSYRRGQIAIKDLSLQDLTVEANVTFVELYYPNAWTYAGFAIRYQDGNSFYWVVLRQNSDSEGSPTSNLKVELCSQYSRIKTVDLGFVGQLNTFYNLKVEVSGNSFKVYVNDVLEITATDDSVIGAGSILLWTGRCKANFDNVLVFNPDSVNVVPEPGPFIVVAVFIVAFMTYMLIRTRTGKKTIPKLTNTL